MSLQKSKYWILVIVLVTLISCEKEVKNGIMPDFKWEYLPGYLLISGIWWIVSAMIGAGIEVLQ